MSRKAIFISLAMTFFIGGFELTIAGTMGKLIAETFHDNSLVKYLLFSYLSGSVIGAFVFGYFADRIGRKRTLESGLLLFAVSSLLLAFAFNPVEVLILLAIQGFAIGGDGVAAGPVIVEYLPSRYRGRAFVVISTIWFLGDLVAAVLGILLISAFSYDAWRIGFAVAALMVIPFALFRFFIHESHVWQNFGRRKVKLGTGVRLFSVLLLVSIIGTVISYAFPFVLLPDFISPYLGFSTLAAAKYANAAIISATVASIVGGFTLVAYLIDKLDRKRSMILGQTYMFLAFIGLAVAVYMRSPLGVIILFGVMSFLSPLGLFAVSLAAIESFPAAIRGKVNGLIAGVSGIFSALTPLVFFAIASRLDVVYSTAILGALAGVAAVALLFISPVRGGESVEEIESLWHASGMENSPVG